MNRYIIHLENRGFSIRDGRELLKKARSLAINNVIIRDARVASKHIEFDVGVEKDNVEQLLNRLKEIAPLKRCVEIGERELSKEEAVKYAGELFNEERYWETHEVLEGVWRNSKGDEKLVVQGIILISAAFVHMQKEENDIAYAIFRRALPKLVIDRYQGIDIAMIREKVKHIIDNKSTEFFKIISQQLC